MLTPADFAELQRETKGFSTKNHHRFLSEALAALRQSGSPARMYELIVRMRGSSYASRGKPAIALSDVIDWLESLLTRTARPIEDLELRLEWARRLTRIAEKEQSNAGEGRTQGGDKGGKQVSTRPFEGALRAIRQNYPEGASPTTRDMADTSDKATGARDHQQTVDASGSSATSSTTPTTGARDSEKTLADGQRARIRVAIAGLTPGTATQSIPKILELTAPGEREAIARECLGRFTPKQIKDARKAEKPWIQQLDAAMSADAEE